MAHLSLVERKEILDSIIEDSHVITKVQWIQGNGVAYFDLVKQHGLEGIVLMRANSFYQIDKRSNHWLKVINYQ
jgi:DNA ligase-1